MRRWSYKLWTANTAGAKYTSQSFKILLSSNSDFRALWQKRRTRYSKTFRQHFPLLVDPILTRHVDPPADDFLSAFSKGSADLVDHVICQTALLNSGFVITDDGDFEFGMDPNLRVVTFHEETIARAKTDNSLQRFE